MRELFILDKKNYNPNGTVGRRPSVRGIIIRDGKVAMMHSKKFDYYKLRCGGIEPGETLEETLIREVREETGLTVEYPVLCGTKQFRTGSGARYVVFFYRASKYHGTLQSSSEGRVFWLPRCELQNQQLAPDMMEMVRVMESDS